MSLPATTRVPMPPLPEDGLVEPFVTTGELVLLIAGAVLTVLLAAAVITFVVRQQRSAPHDG